MEEGHTIIDLAPGESHKRVPAVDDENFEYQVFRCRKGRLQSTVGSSEEAAIFVTKQVDDMAWRALTNAYTSLPLDQIEAMDAFVKANFPGQK